VLVGDAEWDAVAVEPIAAGARVKVLSRKNLTLTVEAV
jgi:membrane-bound ClpP family serine protease